eukprot:scaffold1954_cov268-Pinguiococcus_pyrenoidosus.AAC.256
MQVAASPKWWLPRPRRSSPGPSPETSCKPPRPPGRPLRLGRGLVTCVPPLVGRGLAVHSAVGFCNAQADVQTELRRRRSASLLAALPGPPAAPTASRPRWLRKRSPHEASDH